MPVRPDANLLLIDLLRTPYRLQSSGGRIMPLFPWTMFDRALDRCRLHAAFEITLFCIARVTGVRSSNQFYLQKLINNALSNVPCSREATHKPRKAPGFSSANWQLVCSRRAGPMTKSVPMRNVLCAGPWPCPRSALSREVARWIF